MLNRSEESARRRQLRGFISGIPEPWTSPFLRQVQYEFAIYLVGLAKQPA